MNKILVFLLILMNSTAFCQNDTVQLVSGKQLIVNITEFNKEKVTYNKFQKKSGKIISKDSYIDGYRVFSVTQKGEKSVLYRQDSIIGNPLSVKEMDSFIKGARFAINHYNPKLWALGGAITSFGMVTFDTYLSKSAADPAGLTPGLYRDNAGPVLLSILTPFAFTAVSGTFKVSLNSSKVKDRALLLDDYFIDGYSYKSRSKKVFASLKGSAIGLGLGLLTWGTVQLAN